MASTAIASRPSLRGGSDDGNYNQPETFRNERNTVREAAA